MKTRISLFYLFMLCAVLPGFSQQTETDSLITSLAVQLNAAGIESGMIVTSISSGGAGARAGMLVGDLVVKINDEAVTDTGSFATLRDRFRGTAAHFTVWRNGSYVSLPEIVVPAALSMSGADWSYAMTLIIAKIDGGDMKAAQALLEKDEAAKTLNQKNLLIARLLILPAGSLTPGTEQEKLTNELVTLLSPNDCIAAATLLQTHGRPWSAVALHRKIVSGDPENVSLRLNLARILASVQLNDEAERNVRYILDRPNPGLSNGGFSVAENVMAIIAANRGQADEAAAHRKKAADYASGAVAATANSAPTKFPIRAAVLQVTEETANQLRAAANTIWTKWMESADIRSVNDALLPIILQHPPCFASMQVPPDVCAALKPDERLEFLQFMENASGLMIYRMMSSDDIVKNAEAMDKSIGNLPGGMDPSDSQWFAGLSALLGSDQAALLMEVGKLPSSVEDARRQLLTFKKVEPLIQTAHRGDFAARLATYQKNAAVIRKNTGNSPDVIRQDWNADTGSELGLARDIPLYLVRRDVLNFLFALVDGQPRLVVVQVVD